MQRIPDCSTICMTCLSSDRALYVVKDSDVISEFRNIGLDMQHGKVCWECRAIIKRIILFKKKAILANKILIDNFQGTTLQCLSTLNTRNKDSYDKIILSRLENDSETLPEIEDNIPLSHLNVKIESIEDEIIDFDDTEDHYNDDDDLKTNDNHKVISNVEKSVTTTIDNKLIEVKETEDKDKNNLKLLKTNKKLKCKTKESKTRKKTKKKIKNKLKDCKKNNSNANIINEVDLELFNVNNYIKCYITEDELIHLRDKEQKSSVYLRSKIKCVTCIIPFHNEEEFKNHFDSVHSESIGSYVCTICRSRFPDIQAYDEHKKCHLTTYKCGMCKYNCLGLESILRHMNRNHGKEYSCNVCSRVFNSKGAARYHIKMHNLEECKLCGKQFSDLKLHMISHSKVRTEECPICQKSLKSKSSLRFHLLTHESARKDDAYCAECDTHYKNKHIYRMHLNTNAKHTVPDKECDYCHRKFISKFTLAKHISVVHYNKLDHVCHLCGKKFSIAGHLRNHILVHHEGGSKPRKHICDLCGKGFAIKKCLNDHINSHTGARPYKCTSCTAQFGFKSALYMHNRLKHQNGRKGRKSQPVSVAHT